MEGKKEAIRKIITDTVRQSQRHPFRRLMAPLLLAVVLGTAAVKALFLLASYLLSPSP
jgi:hypothetical protein